MARRWRGTVWVRKGWRGTAGLCQVAAPGRPGQGRGAVRGELSPRITTLQWRPAGTELLVTVST